MSGNNKITPGCLAIIIKSLHGLAMGKIVECTKILGTHSMYGIIWEVKSTRADLVNEYSAKRNIGQVPEDWLRKIPDDPLPEDELIDELEEIV